MYVGDDRLGDRAVHWQAIERQLGAQQLSGRLRASGRPCLRPIGQLDQLHVLQHGDASRELCPTGEACCRPLEVTFQPLRLQIPVGTKWLVGLPIVGFGEQIDRGDHRELIGRQVVQLCPDPRRIRSPSTDEQSLNRGDVPARGNTNATRDQRCRGVTPPQHPSRSQRLLDVADHFDRTGVGNTERPSIGSCDR